MTRDYMSALYLAVRIMDSFKKKMRANIQHGGGTDSQMGAGVFKEGVNIERRSLKVRWGPVYESPYMQKK